MKKFKFTISGKPYEVEVQNIEGNIATVNVNGTDYQVEMEEQACYKHTHESRMGGQTIIGHFTA